MPTPTSSSVPKEGRNGYYDCYKVAPLKNAEDDREVLVKLPIGTYSEEEILAKVAYHTEELTTRTTLLDGLRAH